MTDEQTTPTDTEHDAEIQALQAVLDRMTSYQDGAPEGTVEKELRSALGETDIDLTDAQVTSAVEAIEAGDGPVDAATVLG